MRIPELISILERYAPLEAAASWDVSGLQVASLAEEAACVAVTLEPDPEILRIAAEAGADFIVSHHPLSMQPRFPNRKDAYLEVLSLLLARGISLYSAHTSLDANTKGPAWFLVSELDLQDVEVLDPTQDCLDGAPVFGFGFCGSLRRAAPCAEFYGALRALLGRDVLQVCGTAPERVSRVACCPGSGSSLIPTAAAKGADVFITGDVRYHSALEAAELGLCVFDVGHFILEEMMMSRFADLLAHALPVPVRFFPGRDPFVPGTAMPRNSATAKMNYQGLEEDFESLS
ncbi:MAG: Nif3-like dinuclear metal center hexameric protein [Desulfovibrio sp.]|jgi:dinuclear metal center YbgI/SA1388 family protein|nr:Nif3-like dinuclear metal center hexameric protein [Desulfovibrio sp.]